jgi:hypothetical protein
MRLLAKNLEIQRYSFGKLSSPSNFLNVRALRLESKTEGKYLPKAALKSLRLCFIEKIAEMVRYFLIVQIEILTFAYLSALTHRYSVARQKTDPGQDKTTSI